MTATTAAEGLGETPPAAPDRLALGEMVPDFAGRLLAAFPERREIWRWRAGAPFPDFGGLPPATRLMSWDVTGVWGAAVGEFRDVGPGGILYVGQGADLAPVATGVTTFAWHDTEAGRLAWVEIDAEGRSVLRSTDWTTESDIEESELPAPGVISLERWGDWGYALSIDRLGGALPDVVVLDPAGRTRALWEGVLLHAAGPGGRLLMTLPGATVAVAELDDAEPQPVPWAVTSTPVWSPSGCCAAMAADSPNLGAALVVNEPGRPSFRIVTGTSPAEVVGWTPDERFVVLWSADAGELLRTGAGPGLVFVDLLDRSVNAVPVAGRPVGVALVP